MFVKEGEREGATPITKQYTPHTHKHTHTNTHTQTHTHTNTHTHIHIHIHIHTHTQTYAHIKASMKKMCSELIKSGGYEALKNFYFSIRRDPDKNHLKIWVLFIIIKQSFSSKEVK